MQALIVFGLFTVVVILCLVLRANLTPSVVDQNWQRMRERRRKEDR